MNFLKDLTPDRKIARLPLIGMIDVFFLLLVYFIVSTTLAQPEDELAAALRQQTENASVSDLQPQSVEVRRTDLDVVYVIGGRTVKSQEELTAILRELPKEAGVFLRVNDDAPVWAAAAALQACHDAGYEKLTYVTK